MTTTPKPATMTGNLEIIAYFEFSNSTTLWTYPDEFFSEIHVKAHLEYVSMAERTIFYNKAWEKLAFGGKMVITVPYFSHPRAFASPRIQFPPFSEHSFLFLDKAWRDASPSHGAPGMTCDFPGPPIMVYSYGYDDEWSNRSIDARTFAVTHYLNVVAELYVTLTKVDRTTL